MQLELGIGAPATRTSGAASAPRVLAICLPDLPLQCVRRERAACGDARLEAPLAVAREGRVVACSPGAREAGVRAGDAVAHARAACAGLEVVVRGEEADREALRALAEAMMVLSPAVELAPPDALLLDASGAPFIAGTKGDAAEAGLIARAVALAAELGFRARAVIASGRGPARALARHGGAERPVPPEDTAAALGRLPLTALELPADVVGRLGAIGLGDVAALARLPPETLAHRFGPAGLAAARLARGEDHSRLTPYVPAALPVEALELEAPVESAEPLLFGLKRLCESLAARLAGRGLGAARLELRLRLEPRGEERVPIALAVPSAASSRWLLVVRERLSVLRLPAAVTGFAVAVVDAAPVGQEQLALDDAPRQLAAVETVLARLAARLGAEAVFAARPADRHRPEVAVETAPFRASPREAGWGGAATGRRAPAAGEAEEEGDPGTHRPTRLLPRPQPLVAEGEGGRLTAVRVAGRSLRVLALSPPERLAGEWWAQPYQRDYHRVRVEGLGECWVFRDGADGRLWLHGFFD